MCARVLGGPSSASCSNYALRKTAVDNESILRKAALGALRKNFYVDDLLKPSKCRICKRISKRCAKLLDFTSQSPFKTTRSYFYQSQRVREELASRMKIYRVNF